jgi:hypothetical protein
MKLIRTPYAEIVFVNQSLNWYRLLTHLPEFPEMFVRVRYNILWSSAFRAHLRELLCLRA